MKHKVVSITAGRWVFLYTPDVSIQFKITYQNEYFIVTTKRFLWNNVTLCKQNEHIIFSLIPPVLFTPMSTQGDTIACRCTVKNTFKEMFIRNARGGYPLSSGHSINV